LEDIAKSAENATDFNKAALIEYWKYPAGGGGKKAVHQGEHVISRKAIAQRRPECFR
jgi:hypothetical protein